MDARSALAGVGLLVVAGCSTETAKQGPASDAADDAPSCSGAACPDAGVPDKNVAVDAGGNTDKGPSGPAVFASEGNDGYVASLRIAGGFLYWVGSGYRIVRSPTTSAAVTPLFTLPAGPGKSWLWELAVDDTGIYFSNQVTDEGRGIYSMPLDGSKAPQMLAPATPQQPPTSIAVGGDDICYLQGSDLRHIKKTGGVSTVMAHGGSSNDFRQLVIDGGYVYFQAELGNDAEEMYRLPVTADADAGGPAPEKISPVPGHYTIFASAQADHGDIYWTASDSFFRWSAATGKAAAVGAAEDVRSLAVQDGTIYFSSYPAFGDGTFSKLVVPDGPPQVVAPLSVDLVAVDQKYVFVTSNTRMEIYRFAR